MVTMDQVKRTMLEVLGEKYDSLVTNGHKTGGKLAKFYEKAFIIANERLGECIENIYDITIKSWDDVEVLPLGERARRRAEIERIENERRVVQFARERFVKRVKSGQIEKSVAKYVEKSYGANGWEIEHSRSCVRSESFYLTVAGGKEVKFSLHNTVWQEIEHDTLFIDLGVYTSLRDLYTRIDVFIKEYEVQREKEEAEFNETL